VTYMRVSRDQRGYETTLLFHTPRPGERPRVLYWYRTAPGVRVGRRALDEEAIRALEEAHPDIEFDWPTLLEEAETVPPDVERRPERPRRKPQRPPEVAAAAPPVAIAPSGTETPSAPPSAPSTPGTSSDASAASGAGAPKPSAAGENPLLSQLVGREIASRLRARYADVSARIDSLPDDAVRAAWRQRADALDPDRWETPAAILHGIQHADRLFDELKRELPESD
jgi:hypothetical protein